MFSLEVCVAKRTLAVSECATGINTPITYNFPTAVKKDCNFIICKWHRQEADRTIIFGRWLFEQGLIMEPGGASLAFFFVVRPVKPLTRHAAILDVLARFARLETGGAAALAALGTTCHRIQVVRDIWID